jgi:hypothetical protein
MAKAKTKKPTPKKKSPPKKKKPKPPTVEECQAAILRYQVVQALELSAGVVAALAGRFAEASRACAELASEMTRAGATPGKPLPPSLRAPFAKMQKTVAAALQNTGDVVADRFLDAHASQILRKRLHTEVFEAHLASPVEMASFARGLDDVARAALALPVHGAATSDENSKFGAALGALLEWASHHRVTRKQLAKMLSDAQLDPPGMREGAERRTAWETLFAKA